MGAVAVTAAAGMAAGVMVEEAWAEAMMEVAVTAAAARQWQ